MLALIKNNTVLNRYDIIGEFSEGGWADLPDGSRVSPAQDGWELRGYELKTIAAADAVPNGQHAVSVSVEMIDGAPKYVYQLATDQPSVPDAITRRQFYQILAVRGMITKAEALGAITTGVLPAAFDAMVDLIADEDIEWQARMLLAGATEFQRSNWFVDFFGAMQGLDTAARDDLWRDGFALD